MQSSIKRLAEYAVDRSGFTRARGRGSARAVLVLAYHNIVPDSLPTCGDRSNHLAASALRAQLEELCELTDVVPLDDAFGSDSDDRRPKSVITFDDAYRGALTIGLAELRRVGLPATFFTPPALLGGAAFWWDALADADRGLSDASRDLALRTLRGEGDAIARWAQGAGLSVSRMHAECEPATFAELEEAASVPGITIGSHSWSHPSLPMLPDEELAEQMRLPLAWVRERIPSAVPWIAYPYGHFDERVKQAAALAGYRGGLAVSGGWTDAPPSDWYAVPRLNVPSGISLAGFRLRLKGWFRS